MYFIPQEATIYAAFSNLLVPFKNDILLLLETSPWISNSISNSTYQKINNWSYPQNRLRSRPYSSPGIKLHPSWFSGLKPWLCPWLFSLTHTSPPIHGTILLTLLWKHIHKLTSSSHQLLCSPLMRSHHRVHQDDCRSPYWSPRLDFTALDQLLQPEEVVKMFWSDRATFSASPARVPRMPWPASTLVADAESLDDPQHYGGPSQASSHHLWLPLSSLLHLVPSLHPCCFLPGVVQTAQQWTHPRALVWLFRTENVLHPHR